MFSRLPVCRPARLLSESLRLISSGVSIIISVKRRHHLAQGKKKKKAPLNDSAGSSLSSETADIVTYAVKELRVRSAVPESISASLVLVLLRK